MISLYIKEKKYPTFEILDVAIHIKPGEINLLMGHNGAGKTTIIKSLFGLTEFGGELTIDERKHSFNSQEDIDYFKSQIAYLPDNITLLDYLTPSEYFELMSYSTNSFQDNKYLNNLIQIFNLEKYLDIPIQNLSHGNKKKTQIVSQLMRKTKYLVFDEPTNGLDPDMIITLKRILQKLRDQGVGILISTHDLNFGEKLFNQINIIRDGSIKLCSTFDEVKLTYGDILLEDLYTKVNKEYYKYIEGMLDEIRISGN